MIDFEQNLTISEQFLTLLVHCAACHSKKEEECHGKTGINTFFHIIIEHDLKFEQYMIVFEQSLTIFLTISEQFLNNFRTIFNSFGPMCCVSFKKGRGVSW